jgi:eukaryotic-like serine/threonine-protein kinase
MSMTSEMVGPYVLGRRLGQGGFATVYEARHRDTNQKVALKILHGTKELEPEVQRRFIREISLGKKLDHPNIVRVYEAGLHEGSIYSAMELVECGTLKEVLIARYCLSWREAAEVTAQVCRALSYAHVRGCVHRDLKPANLYLSEDGLVKVGDFGLARDLTDTRLTVAGQTVGTWRYMPPEQITGRDCIDGRLDLYAFGCIAFEMVAGHVPFDGTTYFEIFDQHLESAPARLDVLRADCPGEFADLVDWMLAKDPYERPENGHVVAEACEQLLASRASSGTRKSKKSTPVKQLSSDELNLTQRLQSGAHADRSTPNWKLLGIVAAVLLAVVVGVVMMGR